MNTLPTKRKELILNTLVEGNSIRSTERITNTHRDTIMRLLVQTGDICQKLMDSHIKNFHSRLIQVDEIWCFVKKKEMRLTPEERLNSEYGDQYVFVALDAETKLIPLFKVGKRNKKNTVKFITDLQNKLTGNGKIQLTTDVMFQTSQGNKGVSLNHSSFG